VSPGGEKMTVWHAAPAEAIAKAVEAIGYEAFAGDSHEVAQAAGSPLDKLLGWLKRGQA
jgi:hypothetical protein